MLHIPTLEDSWALVGMYVIGCHFFSGGHPTMNEKLFNHRHAKLQNVIERAFVVLKAHFPT